MNFKLKLAYHGTAYHGWQQQDNAISVQEIIEKAYKKISGHSIELIGCGRTDTGVHAKTYFANFETDYPLLDELVYKINSVLPKDIAIMACTKANKNFHARFSAKRREYRYFIHENKNPFLINKSFLLSKPLNIEVMNLACKILMEYDDFASFCKKWADNKTTNCKIYEAHWFKSNQQIVFKIVADRFLRNMVRAIVGAMVDVGLQNISLADFRIIIENKNRQFTGTSVPACGLYLWNVKY